MTRAGVILGTAAYMSPEQARGRKVDKRTDIWAFGCVLYEMLSGKMAFPGDDITDILAAIIRAEPLWSDLPDGSHPRLRELLERCLEKDARLRWHDIADVRVDIEKVQANPDESRVEPQVLPPTNLRSRLTWGVMTFVLGALLAGFAAWNLVPRPAADSRTVRFSFDVPSGPNQSLMSMVEGHIAISPNGERIAYLGTRTENLEDPSAEPVRQIYLRAMEESDGTPIPGTEGAKNLFFSPDSAWVGFVAGGKLQIVPIAGGAPLDITNVSEVFGADWGPDDRIIFGGGIDTGLLQVSTAGGTPEILTSLDPEKGENSHGNPEILPDGRTVLFTIGTQDGSRIASLSLDTGDWEDLSLSGSNPRYLPAGYIVFSQKGNLRLVPFDLSSMRPGGSVQPVQDGIEAISKAGLEIASFDLSPTGDLVFVPGSLGSQTQPVWVDRTGEETVIDASPGMYYDVRISPDGRRIATTRTDEQGIGEIWVMNADGSQAFPVATDGAEYAPVWTPDGSTLTYHSNGVIFERIVDRNDPRSLFLTREKYRIPSSWSPDGQFLAFREASSAGSSIWIVSRGENPEPLVDLSFNSSAPRFAPQGGWIAYHSDESGQVEIYVRQFPGTERAEPVSPGREPVWSPDGRELFYRSGDRMMAVEIQTEPEFESGEPVELWKRPYFSQDRLFTRYDVASDGRFLMLGIPNLDEAKTMTINVVLNWFEELKERVPVP
jgi:Tol biopolymer transport system component